MTDLDHRFTFVNRAFSRTYGYTLAEVLGRTPALVQSPDTPASVVEEMLATTRRGPWHGQLLNRRKDGRATYPSPAAVHPPCR